jgi:CRP-like cAMP-binding protein
MHVSPIDVVVNAGYALMLAGFLLRDVLWLRLALMTGQACIVAYAWAGHRMPVLCWNALFMAINALWVARIVRERRPARIPGDLRDLYERVFSAMSPKEFLAFWRSGTPRTWEAEPVVREGAHPPDVHIVTSGTAVVERAGQTLAHLERGRFLAEMSYLTSQPASADIRGDGPLRTLSWSRRQLDDLRAGKPALFLKLQGILGCELAAKIRDINLAVTGAA